MGALSETGVTVTGLNSTSLQADRAITEILVRFGAELTVSEDAVTVRRGALHGITLDAGPIPDLIPVVSCLAALCEGETRIINAARLRLKESDRLQTTAALISALGGSVRELRTGWSFWAAHAFPAARRTPAATTGIAMSAGHGRLRLQRVRPRYWEANASRSPIPHSGRILLL